MRPLRLRKILDSGHRDLNILRRKVIMQGKLFQRCTHLLCCSVVLSLEGNVNTRRMSQPDMGSISHIKNQRNILVIKKYYVNYQNFQNSMLLSSSDTKRTLIIYSCLQIPPRENWFQYVWRVYATAINYPCITFLDIFMFSLIIQGCNGRKVNFSCIYSAYILKPVLSGRNL